MTNNARAPQHPAPPSRHDVGMWEVRSEWPLAVLAVAFLGGYAWPILQPDLPHWGRLVCRWVAYAAWLAFLADYLVRLWLADNRKRYAARHVIDLVVILLPVLRPLRLLRLVMLLRVMNRRATNALRGRVVVYVVSSTVLVILCAALAVLNAERHRPGANIESFGDALWWATVTMATVGYGDRFPVTAEGRFVGLGVMLAGIALLGVVTASIASWLIERVREVEEDSQAATRHDIAELRDEIRTLHEQLALRIADGGGTGPGFSGPSR
jgi:voltage-gated potassium channel